MRKVRLLFIAFVPLPLMHPYDADTQGPDYYRSAFQHHADLAQFEEPYHRVNSPFALSEISIRHGHGATFSYS